MSKFVDATGVAHLWQRSKAAFVGVEDGKGLSTNDFTNELKTKLEGIDVSAAPSHYEGTRQSGETDAAAITRILAAANATAAKDDTLVIKTLISDDKYSYIAFVYDGEKWAAMDGNYDADNVYFREDFVITTEWGNIKLSNGQATVPAAGKNIPGIFQTALTKESNPTVTQPTVTVKISNGASSTPAGSNISVEAGTSITPKFSATLSSGAYQFGPATGITASTWSVTDTKKNTAVTSASGTFPEFKIAAGESYKVTATATHESGAVPLTNLKKPYAAGQIAAGSKIGNSPTITGYQQGYFIGTLTDGVAAASLTSAQIRSASKKKNTNYAAGKVPFTVPVGAKTIFIAVPGNKTGVTKVLNTTVNADMTESFASATVKVAGADGDTSSSYAIGYKVYAFSPAEAYGSTANLEITLG